MENRIRKKVNGFLNKFKDDIIIKLSGSNELSDTDLSNYISNYPRLNLNEDDFSKRKRVKNHVPEYDRCGAKRADGCQCTRRKKDGQHYCGTHLKGTPHGEISIESDKQMKKIELQVITDINGISHYYDEKNTQYPAELVLNACNNVS